MQRTRLLPLLALTLAVSAASFGARPAARAATGRAPVIVIPGVAGSELSAAAAFHLDVQDGHSGVYTRDYTAGEKVWINVFQAALPGDDDYFDALKLQPDGATPVAPDLRVSDIYHSAYDDLIAYLQGQGYQPGVDLWLFPYDWRRDIRDTAEDLDALVTRALVAANGGRADPATWTIRRADIVAHSMGGLVARYYLSNAAHAARIDRLLTLGAPQLGAAKFLKTLIYGDDFGSTFLGLGLNPDEVRDVVQNMPGPMELLPSRAYYAYYDNSDASRLRPYVEDRDVDGDGLAGGVLDYAGVKQLLFNLGKNRAVLGAAETYHDAIEGGPYRLFLPLILSGAAGAPDAPPSVRWDALVGYGYGTLGQIHEYTGTCGADPCVKRDELPVDGDGTVALMSAAMGDPTRNNLLGGARLWYVQRQHGDLVKADYTLGLRTGDGPALKWIGDLLAGATPTTAERAPATALNGIWVAALGQAALQVRDAGGRATGRARASDPAQPAIADTRYERLPGSEFVFLKRSQSYTIVVQAERAGSVDLKVRVLESGQVARTAIYAGVRLGARGQARLALQPAAGRAPTAQGWPALAVDGDGDGVFEQLVPVSALRDGLSSSVLRPPSSVGALPQAANELEHLAGLQHVVVEPLRQLDGQAQRRTAARAHRVDRGDRKRAAAETVGQAPQLGVIRGLPRQPEIDRAALIWAKALFPLHIYPPGVRQSA